MTQCPVCNNKISFLKVVNCSNLKCNRCDTRLYLNKKECTKRVLPLGIIGIFYFLIEFFPFDIQFRMIALILFIIFLFLFFVKFILYLNSAKLETKK